MKLILTLAVLFALSSCGKKTSANDERIVNGLCTDTRTTNCELPAQFQIKSKTALPSKIKVYFKNKDVRTLAFDQCKPNARYGLFPILGFSMIAFWEKEEIFQEGMKIEIVDAGVDCQNDALFFDEEITPVKSDSWANTKITLTFLIND